MSRAKANKLYRTFVKGLITEAGYLTYPEEASTAEMNTVLSRKGNRTRRLGVNYEDAHVLVDVDYTPGDAVQEFMWVNANNDPLQNFLALQIGTKIHFFVIDANPVSDNKAPFILSLTDHMAPGASVIDIQTKPASFAAGAGFLFVCHEDCEPLNIEYKPKTNTIEVVEMAILIRDLDGVDDGLANDQEPATLSVQHHYNLLNQGWGYPGTGGTGGYYYNPYTGTDSSGGGSTGTTSPTSPGGGGSGSYEFDKQLV